jgi:hypothetical protein
VKCQTLNSIDRHEFHVSRLSPYEENTNASPFKLFAACKINVVRFDDAIDAATSLFPGKRKNCSHRQ